MEWTLNQIMQTYEGGPFTRDSALNTIRASSGEQARDALENMLYTDADIDMTNGDIMKMELIRLVNNTVAPGHEGRKKRKGSKLRSRRKVRSQKRSSLKKLNKRF